ncbi:MAG: FtsW/RodA/SpoVE family cell cycle protein [Lachnospiraceae bacterium]|nr:FtsW/RodA/SpoVE family cell cycle protein [Lachnospiraceae bacterium]
MTILTSIMKYLFVILMALFVLRDYTYLAHSDERKRKRNLNSQIRIMYLTVGLGYVIIMANKRTPLSVILPAGIFLYFAVTLICYRLIYPKASMLLVNNMLMLLGVGFIMIGRINESQALKQFLIAAGGTVLAFIIPVLIRRLRILASLTWLYAFVGIVALLGVLALARMSGGAKLSLTVGGITIQFSELVKITLVFFLASKLSRNISFRNVVIATAVAALHVVLLVLSTDLGTALVFFITYIVIVYVATRKPLYPAAGLLGGALASVAAYHLFGHVRQRVTAWKDPFAVYDTSGYQIVQGLFAIGAGGWFGTGLCRGRPDTIPVATKDYIFAAICEEFGAFFAICLLLACMSMYILIINISMLIRNRFYKLVAIGLGTEYAFQVFLTVGGVTKFIPLTGITLPLVSYGGSSVISTIIMLAIIQGLYILREDEE